MDISTEVYNGIPTAALTGRFDAFEVPSFVKWLESNITPGTPFAIINLAGVEFIDSSGLTALVKGLKRCREREGDLVLCELQQAVQIIFELTRLDTAFKIYHDEQSALQSLVQS
jgi:anti-sigma B factor antagonist